MQFRRIIPVLTVLDVLSAHVGGDVIPFTFHSFCGSATANVFDGGPPVSDGGCISDPFSGPLVSSGNYRVSDSTTMGGSLSAIASAISRSAVGSFGDGIGMSVGLLAGYSPSGYPGGDNPGGTAQAELHSVIEFVMPVDTLDWTYYLRIDEDPPFYGSTLITIDNVTQSTRILTLTSETYSVTTTLDGHAGDLIRIASEIYGYGSMGPGSDRDYHSYLDMSFTPEPSTIVTLLTATLCVRRRGRQ